MTFTIADLSNPPTDDADEFNEDKALYDEEASDMPTNTQSGGAHTKGAINQGRTKDGNVKIAPEDSIAPADREEIADDESPAQDGDQEPNFPARINVTIDKPGNGCLHFETLAQDGMIMIENVFFYKNTKLADAGTAELDWTRRNVYAGPPFANLDEELQVLLERYLEERGSTPPWHFGSRNMLTSRNKRSISAGCQVSLLLLVSLRSTIPLLKLAI